MQKELVVAAYQADLSWLKTVSEHVKITVYRKGEKSADLAEIFLEENVGRCVHTFFNHIVTRYDSLADLTFFVQDFPFDHWRNVVESLDQNIEQLRESATISSGHYFGFNTKYFDLLPASQTGVGSVYVSSSDGHPHHTNDGIDVDRYWAELFEDNSPLSYEFNPGGHFAATKEHIHLRSKSFYSKVLDLLESERIAPYTVERLENYIFNPAFKSKL
jgi:hypothetical protein